MKHPHTDGIAAAITIGVINYVLLGFEFPVDGFYMHSLEIWLATTVVFFGSGNIGFTLLEYRLGEKNLVSNTMVVASLPLIMTRISAERSLGEPHVDTFLVNTVFCCSFYPPS